MDRRFPSPRLWLAGGRFVLWVDRAARTNGGNFDASSIPAGRPWCPPDGCNHLHSARDLVICRERMIADAERGAARVATPRRAASSLNSDWHEAQSRNNCFTRRSRQVVPSCPVIRTRRPRHIVNSAAPHAGRSTSTPEPAGDAPASGRGGDQWRAARRARGRAVPPAARTPDQRISDKMADSHAECRPHHPVRHIRHFDRGYCLLQGCGKAWSRCGPRRCRGRRTRRDHAR